MFNGRRILGEKSSEGSPYGILDCQNSQHWTIQISGLTPYKASMTLLIVMIHPSLKIDYFCIYLKFVLL